MTLSNPPRGSDIGPLRPLCHRRRHQWSRRCARRSWPGLFGCPVRLWGLWRGHLFRLHQVNPRWAALPQYYKFRLVAESLRERETCGIWRLISSGPCGSCCRTTRACALNGYSGWLFIYDHLGGRKLLPRPLALILAGSSGRHTAETFDTAFEYSDCWVEDSRLVILNLRDAWLNGAEVMPRTKLISRI